jgi:hypothetical protein
VTKRYQFFGRRIRLGLRYPEDYLETTAGSFPVTWTPCNLGGHRAWFVCRGCEKRTSVLYAPNYYLDERGRGDWRCRHCHKIEYSTQYEDPLSNDIARTWRAAKKLGLDSILDPPELVTRPYGMRRKIFEQRLREYLDARGRMESNLSAWVNKTHDNLEKLSNHR